MRGSEGNPPSDGCQDSGDSDLPVPSMREWGHRQNGRNRYGNQQYHCKACGAYGVLEPKVRYTEAQKEPILRAYPERVSLRGLHRL